MQKEQLFGLNNQGTEMMEGVGCVRKHTRG